MVHVQSQKNGFKFYVFVGLSHFQLRPRMKQQGLGFTIQVGIRGIVLSAFEQPVSLAFPNEAARRYE